MKPQKLLVLEANIDDMNPQWYGPVMDRLFAAGARDVTLIPVIMKKSRPGIILQVLGDRSRRDRLLKIVLDETTTLGVRTYSVDRVAAKREQVRVKTPFGLVPVKIARNEAGKIQNAMPENDACVALARKKSVPVKKIYQAALAAMSKA